MRSSCSREHQVLESQPEALFEGTVLYLLLPWVQGEGLGLRLLCESHGHHSLSV